MSNIYKLEEKLRKLEQLRDLKLDFYDYNEMEELLQEIENVRVKLEFRKVKEYAWKIEYMSVR